MPTELRGDSFDEFVNWNGYTLIAVQGRGSAELASRKCFPVVMESLEKSWNGRLRVGWAFRRRCPRAEEALSEEGVSPPLYLLYECGRLKGKYQVKDGERYYAFIDWANAVLRRTHDT